VRQRESVQRQLFGVVKPVGVAGLVVVLLLAQPDFGSSVLLLGITACMLVLGGAPVRRIALPILLMLPALVLLVVFEPYRMRRVTSFMDPWQDQLGAGYQLSNALMAIGRGEWFGVGLGASVQKLSYLPEAHTDFIFSVIAEELGLVGVCLVAYASLAWQLHQVSSLREEKAALLGDVAQLQANVAALEKKGGRITMTTCGGRLCIEASSNQGEGAEKWKGGVWSNKETGVQLVIPRGY